MSCLSAHLTRKPKPTGLNSHPARLHLSLSNPVQVRVGVNWHHYPGSFVRGAISRLKSLRMECVSLRLSCADMKIRLQVYGSCVWRCSYRVCGILQTPSTQSSSAVNSTPKKRFTA